MAATTPGIISKFKVGNRGQREGLKFRSPFYQENKNFHGKVLAAFGLCLIV
jgi:hypothetical protein